MQSNHKQFRAFTLVEMLVVMGVVVVLLSIALPVYRGTMDTGRQTTEMSAARQLMLAYTMYTSDHRDALMPGYLHDLPAHNEAGYAITGEPAARYPWRIAPYLDYDFRGLYQNINAENLEAMQFETDGDYLVSLTPSLGINGQWVGGDERENSFNPVAIAAYGRFCVSYLAEVKRADTLLVFTSARGLDPLEPDGPVVEGYFKVLSPRFRAAGDEQWSEDFDSRLPPADFGFVSPRYAGNAVTSFVDGHVELLGESALRDMRHWANLAKTADYGVTNLP